MLVNESYMSINGLNIFNIQIQKTNISNYYQTQLPSKAIIRVLNELQKFLDSFSDSNYFRSRGTMVLPTLQDKLNILKISEDDSKFDFNTQLYSYYYLGIQIRFFVINKMKDCKYYFSFYKENEETSIFSVFISDDIIENDNDMLRLFTDLSMRLIDICLNEKFKIDIDNNMIGLPLEAKPVDIVLFLDYYICFFECMQSFTFLGYKDYINSLGNFTSSIFECWSNYFGSDEYMEEIFDLVKNKDYDNYDKLAKKLLLANLK